MLSPCPTPLPGETANPLMGGTDAVSVMQWVGPLRVCTGVYPHGIRLVDGTWESRWFSPLGHPPPTVRPIGPLSFGCVSLARRPRDRGRRPGSGEPGERVRALRRPPHVLDRPLRRCPSETLGLLIILPIRSSLTISYLRARDLPFIAPGGWPRSITERGRADPRKRL
jgi:hypothetical protein